MSEKIVNIERGSEERQQALSERGEDREGRGDWSQAQ